MFGIQTPTVSILVWIGIKATKQFKSQDEVKMLPCGQDSKACICVTHDLTALQTIQRHVCMAGSKDRKKIKSQNVTRWTGLCGKRLQRNDLSSLPFRYDRRQRTTCTAVAWLRTCYDCSARVRRGRSPSRKESRCSSTAFDTRRMFRCRQTA